jgi:hypothetical protein
MTNLDELTAVFWDGMLEETLKLENFEEWMRNAKAEESITEWRLSLGKLFPKKVWEGDIKENHKNLWDEMYTSINGDLSIAHSNLTNLKNLTGIRLITGNLEITQNKSLKSLNGLNSLTYIGKNLYFYHNNSIKIFDNLNSLTKIKDDLIIKSNKNLQQIKKFKNLAKIGWNLEIRNNPSLNQITFNNTKIYNDIRFTNNNYIPKTEELGISLFGNEIITK